MSRVVPPQGKSPLRTHCEGFRHARAHIDITGEQDLHEEAFLKHALVRFSCLLMSTPTYTANLTASPHPSGVLRARIGGATMSLLQTGRTQPNALPFRFEVALEQKLVRECFIINIDLSTDGRACFSPHSSKGLMHHISSTETFETLQESFCASIRSRQVLISRTANQRCCFLKVLPFQQFS